MLHKLKALAESRLGKYIRVTIPISILAITLIGWDLYEIRKSKNSPCFCAEIIPINSFQKNKN